VANKLAGGDVTNTNLFSADGKFFYFNPIVSVISQGGFLTFGQNFALI
jgi:hypothetical protein